MSFEFDSISFLRTLKAGDKVVRRDRETGKCTLVRVIKVCPKNIRINTNELFSLATGALCKGYSPYYTYSVRLLPCIEANLREVQETNSIRRLKAIDWNNYKPSVREAVLNLLEELEPK